MEIALAALVAAAVAVSVALLVQRPRAAQAANGVPPSRPPGEVASSGGADPARSDELEDELRVRRAELARLEERLRAREGSIERAVRSWASASAAWMTASATWSTCARS